MTNLQEFIAGTDPHNSADAFRVDNPMITPNAGLQLRFRVIPERIYEFKKHLS